MASSNYYVNLASRHQVYLERLKAGYSKNYRRDLRKIDRLIKEALYALNVSNLGELTRKDFKQLLRDLRKAQGAIYTAQADEFTKQLRDLSKEEVSFERQAINAATIGVTAETATDAWKYTLRNPIQSAGQLLEPFLSELSTREIARVEREITTAYSQGRTIDATVTAVRGTKRANYKDGVLNTNWNDARTVIRTATQHVSTQARMAVWEANSNIISQYQWVSTLDSDTSPQCRGLDTEVFDIGKGPLPPIHPNCRSTVIPYFDDDVELDGKKFTRSSVDGRVPAKMSYYEWLKTQPKEFQIDAIGPNRAKLLNNGGLSAKEFTDLQLNRNFEPLTLEEMRKLKPNAFNKADI